jgi:hypothetical protein
MTLHIVFSTFLFVLALSISVNTFVEVLSVLAKVQFYLMSDPKGHWKYTMGRPHLWNGFLWGMWYWHFITFVR